MGRRAFVAALLTPLALAACGGSAPVAVAPTARPVPPAAAPSIAPAPSPTPTSRVLDIPLHLQEQRATCEVAALRMALSSLGIVTDEASLLALTGIDRRPPLVDGAGGILRWGDPDRSFVGDPAGSPDDHTGYGVYAAPIARAAQRTGATVTASGTGVEPATVYAAVLSGRPAVTWVTNDYQPSTLRTWVAWDGAAVRYTLREHAVLVVGVTPTSVLVNDPWWGRRWHTRSEFESAYATFGDMAVIVGLPS